MHIFSYYFHIIIRMSGVFVEAVTGVFVEAVSSALSMGEQHQVMTRNRPFYFLCINFAFFLLSCQSGPSLFYSPFAPYSFSYSSIHLLFSVQFFSVFFLSFSSLFVLLI